jgi:hypothetical protein
MAESEGPTLTLVPDGRRAGVDQPNWLQEAEQRNAILRFKRSGLTNAEISIALARLDPPVHVTPDAVRQVVRRYLERIVKTESETTEELRALENERLDQMLQVWGPKARAGDRHAAAVVLRIAERRAKMNGLDAPTRVDHNVNGSILHELGTDAEEVARQREAFETAFGQPGLPDPAASIIDLSDDDVTEVDGSLDG